MGYLNNSGLTRFWNAIKSKFIRTINGIGPDANGNVSVDTCEFINGTQTAATGSFTGVSRDTALYNGKHIFYRLPYAGTSTAATMNLTLADGTTTGALPVFYRGGVRLTTHYAANTIISMTYVSADDAWICDADYDTDSYAYAIRAQYNRKVYTNLYRYQFCFTKDDTYILPVNTVDNNTGTSKQLTTEEFNPFGDIYWYWTTTSISANGNVSGTNLIYNYWVADMRYSFNCGTTLTASKDVYIVCVPQKNGKVKLANPAITQELPTTEDGLVYIRLGRAYDTYRVEMGYNKPIYYYMDGAIREWTNAPGSDVTQCSTDESIFEIRHSKAVDVSFDSEVVRKITGCTINWNQLAIAPFGQTTMGVTFSRSSDRTTVTMDGTVTGGTIYKQFSESPKTIIDHIYFVDKGSDLTTFMIYNDNAGVKTELANRRCIGKATAEKKFYIWCGNGTTYDNVSFKPMIVDLTAAFGTSIANYIFSLGSEAGYRYLIDSGLPFGQYHSPTHDGSWNPISTLANTYFDEYATTGFNLWDEEVVMGYFSSTGTWNTDTEHVSSKYPITVMPNTTYYFKCSAPAYVTFWKNPVTSGSSSPEEFISRTSSTVGGITFTTPSDCRAIHFNLGQAYGATYNHDVCINLSDASRNGKYESYRHSRITFFDNPILLRGILYLDENNNLRSNGDTLEAPRKLTRRYSIVDLGALDWNKSSTVTGAFAATIPESLASPYKYALGVEMRCSAYVFDGNGNSSNGYYGADGTIRYYYSASGSVAREVYVTDVSKDSLTAAQFKAAMSGVMLVYELETPTEEEFTPIDGPLVSDPLGLEVIAKSDWDDTPILAQMDILYANEVRANVEMIATNKILASQNSAKDLSKCITVKPGKLLANGTDLNTVKTFGEYYLWVPGTNNTYTNAAFIGNSKLLVIDMQGSDYDDPMYTGGVMQIQVGEIYDSTTGVRTNKAYSRIYYSGTTWSTWKPIQGGSGLFYGSSATAAGTATKDVVCPEFTAVDLVPGTTISVKFDNTNSAAVGSLALNVNGTGAHNVKYVYNGSYSNIPGANYIKAGQLYLFTYDGTYWVVQMMYNTNSAPGLYYYGKKTYTVLNPYMLCLTKDSEYVLPVNTQNTTATTKTMTTEAFDPFGEIYYYAGSSAVSAGSNAFAGNAYTHYSLGSVLDLRYSFNTGTTLTARKDVYLVCQPQFSSGKPTGKVTLYTPYVTQTIPVTDQSNPVMGLIYIKIGNAYDTYRIQLDPQKPIYYYDGANIVPWHGFETLQSTDVTIANGDKLVVTDASDNDKVARTSVAFDGSTTTQVLSKKGTWVTLPSQQTVPEPATATPLPPITNGAVGTATKYAREDHAHPSDITKASSTHTHGNITNAGALQTTDITIANGDKLVVTDSDNSGKVARASIAFDGSTETQVLSKKGTWVTLPSTPTAAGITDTPQPDAAAADVGTSAKYARADHVHPTSVHGIPSGGTTGQFLVKNSNTNYDVAWVTVPNANGVSF